MSNKAEQIKEKKLIYNKGSNICKQASKHARIQHAGISLDDERRRRAASVGAQNKGRHCYGAVEGYPPPPAGRLVATAMALYYRE